MRRFLAPLSYASGFQKFSGFSSSPRLELLLEDDDLPIVCEADGAGGEFSAIAGGLVAELVVKENLAAELAEFGKEGRRRVDERPPVAFVLHDLGDVAKGGAAIARFDPRLAQACQLQVPEAEPRHVPQLHSRL